MHSSLKVPPQHVNGFKVWTLTILILFFFSHQDVDFLMCLWSLSTCFCQTWLCAWWSNISPMLLKMPDALSTIPQLNGAPVTALVNLESFITPAHPLAQPKIVQPCATLMAICVHRDVREIPAMEVQVRNQWGEWPVTIRLIPNLPMPLLIGRDWPGFLQFLSSCRAIATAPAKFWPRRKKHLLMPVQKVSQPLPLTFSILCLSRLQKLW